MIVRIDKAFQKDVSKIGQAKIKSQLIELIEELQESEKITSIKNLKKLSGFKDMYRIRLGNYRVGLRFTEAEEIILIRFLHRKDIYQKWP